MMDQCGVGKALVATGSAMSLWSLFVLLSSTPPTTTIKRSTVSFSSMPREDVFRATMNQMLLSNETTQLLPAEVNDFFDSPESSSDKFASSDGIDVKLTNSYSRLSPTQSGEEYAYPWKYVAEPYRTATLSVVGGEGSLYTWFVDGHVQGYGSKVDAMWTSTGSKTVAVVDAETGEYAAVRVMVKYVRREIRTLTDRDRETFFQAMMIIQRVPTEVGKKLFGNAYYSKDYFTRVHLNYGGMADCDHWHQGAGFVTSHVGITLQFEQSLQSISPDVAVPYWDFTLESTFYGPETFRSSPVFSSDWFGDASPDNELHTITEGRWAFARVATDVRDFSEVYNSYGMLRAPWNNDPTPFLTRYRGVYGYENNLKPSGCEEYSKAVKKNNWMAMSHQLNSAAHGHIHETIGGSWNSLKHAQTDPAVLEFAHEAQALSKDLWRAGFVECPQHCSMDTPSIDCKCQCSPETLKSEKSYEILYQAGVLDSVQYYDEDHHKIERWIDEANNGTVYYVLPGYTAEQSRHIYDSLLELLCDPGHIGEMYQASSTSDVTFWVLHPTVDRLWHYKRLGADEDYDETWIASHSCYGHDPTDIQPFKNIFPGDDDDMYSTSFYTNSELYDKLRPDAETIPYMYDNFAWPHCDFLGKSVTNR